jgi:hypothetical protein
MTMIVIIVVFTRRHVRRQQGKYRRAAKDCP